MEIKNIELQKIYDSGQSFRWLKINEGRYVIPYLKGACEIIQKSESVAEIIEEYGEKEDWTNYFDLYRNYQEIDLILKKEYPEFERMIDFSKGIRILNQAHLETVITFIFSANNNIKRIMNSVNGICQNYGTKIYDKKGKKLFLFPEVNVLANIDEKKYRESGAGYRSSYLVDTVNWIKNHQEEFRLYEKLDDENLLKNLESLKGVGPKVARCIALFSYSREHMFPIDTWIKKAIKTEFDMPDASDKQISDKVDEYFKIYRGIMQQYIFYYYRFGKK